ncbi:hypothetical protein B0H16DRAFT_1807896 [Mycena metata]|uniref:Uncharacterized protein n=1 Tax=Mycena metata TaxID=1033252 RepID=A0AAD7MFS7_9AGAR|nr:hypothetical protein B0H16DRAFT_1807896 [Mycena metata]
MNSEKRPPGPIQPYISWFGIRRPLNHREKDRIASDREVFLLPKDMVQGIARPETILPPVRDDRQIEYSEAPVIRPGSSCVSYELKVDPIVLSLSTSRLRLLKVLISNKPAAACVKVFNIHLLLDDVLKSFPRLIQLAVPNLTALKSLNYSSSPALFSAFAHTHFPRPHDCLIPLCADTTAFLRLHPTIIQLGVLPDSDPPTPPVYPGLSEVSLPALRDFSGPAGVVRQVVAGSSLIEVVTISWDRRLEEGYSAVLVAFATTQTPLRMMRNFVFAWDAALLLAIAKHLPHLTLLSIWNIDLYNTSPDDGALEAYYDGLKTAILDLPHLSIIVCTSHVEHTPPSIHDLDLEFRTVRECGARSAALHRCTLTSSTMWVRGAENFWYPCAANKDRAESQWRLLWLVELVLAARTEFPGYAAEMERMLGKAHWPAALKKLNLSAE